MLGNRDEKQKQKSQLVFKLFKSMDPYLINLNQNQQMRSKLLTIFKQSAQKIIPQQEQSSDQQSVDLKVHNRLIIKNIASQVFNIAVANGEWWDAQAQLKKKMLQEALAKEIQAQRQSKIIRKEIETIHHNVYSKFNIKKQINRSGNNFINSNNYSNFTGYSAHNSLPYQSRINRQGVSKLNIPIDSNAYKISNQFYNTQKPYPTNPQGWYSQRTPYKSNINTHTTVSNYYSSSNIYAQQNDNLQQITDKFCHLRSGLSQLQYSPMKTYRHETDKNKYVNNYVVDQNNINDYQQQNRQQFVLGLDSNISHKTNRNNIKLSKAKSQAMLKKNKYRKKDKQEQRSNVHINRSKSNINIRAVANNNNNKSKVDMNNRSKISKIILKNPKIMSDVNEFNKKIEQKTLLHTQKLDMQIMSSLLHKKMMKNDKSNTISALIK